MKNPSPMTAPTFALRKGGEPLVVLTAYDFLTAQLFDQCGVDCLLVGDSLGVVVQGKGTTVEVTMDQMVYHTSLVSRASKHALVVGDLPFLSYHTETASAVRNAGRLIQEGGAGAVKLEGGVRVRAQIEAIVSAQIPVMGHVGLTPQSIKRFGRYRVQRDEQLILDDARAIEEAGAFSIVIESVPASLAAKITAAVSIPTIGIGAGPSCDGQVLVWQDALGLLVDFDPKFVKRFADVHGEMKRGVEAYCREVRTRSFPDEDHSYR
ncbi:3-methyl-2-oxobutanoate hydroxymethyltransferase [bacterium]|nr:3-methyl-2-oxobutanoate hydroxymethyltransferase [bacterium]